MTSTGLPPTEPIGLPEPHELAKVRVVATDIDGTLLRTGHPIADRTAAAIDACDEAGITVIPVTRRPIRWMTPIADQVPDLPLTICSNGAVVYDLQAREVIEAATVPDDALADFVARRDALLPHARLGFETLQGLLIEPDFTDQPLKRAGRTDFGDWRTPAASGVVKVLVRLAGQMDSDELLAQVTPLARGCMHASHSNSTNGLVELAPAGVTKAGALENFCTQRGITRDQVAAFGDMPNDLEMLGWAGFSFAMSGGHPRVLEACPSRAPALADGGIAAVLEAILAAHAS